MRTNDNARNAPHTSGPGKSSSEGANSQSFGDAKTGPCTVPFDSERRLVANIALEDGSRLTRATEAGKIMQCGDH